MLGLRVQNKWGLSGGLDYTYSHEIDLNTYDLSDFGNPRNLKHDKGSGALDHRPARPSSERILIWAAVGLFRSRPFLLADRSQLSRPSRT
jgi:hypothetical protein